MLADSKAFSGYAVDDIEEARAFYGETLGLNTEMVDAENGLMTIHLAGDRDVLVYHKPDYVPATYTVLNFIVDEVEAVVDWLDERGISIERYDGFDQDEKGILRGPGPDIVWFKDPAGNILSALSEA